MEKPLPGPGLRIALLRALAGCVLSMITAVAAAPVAIPYLQNFTSGTGSFVPAISSVWTLSAEKYRATPGGTTIVAAAAIEGPQFSSGFKMQATLSRVANGNSGNTCGLAFCASDGAFNINTAPYYLADVKPDANTMRLVRVDASATTMILNDHVIQFPLDIAQPFNVTVAGTYLESALSVRITISQGANESVHVATDSVRLTGTYYGLRCRAGTGSMTVDFDDFSLRSLSTVSFTTTPAGYAQIAQPYSSSIAAISSGSGTASIIPEQLPAWLSFTPGPNGTGTLSGTPPPGSAGSILVRLRAEDGNGPPLIQDFPINVLATSGVIISEFLASSNGDFPDEDGDESDWLEILNASPAPVDLSGWKLKDDATTWTVPNGITLPAYSTMVVFASDKNRSTLPLHTNFKLSSSAGGYLALLRPDNSIASEYTSYPIQKKGISYGHWGTYESIGYLLNPTPNANNTGQGYLGFVADPAFSIARGFYNSTQSLTLSSPVAGGTLSYTLDGSTPTLTHGTIVPPPNPGATPSATLNITGTTVVRAGVFLPSYAPSTVITNTYFFLDDVVTQSPTGAVPGPGWPAGPVNDQLLYYGMRPIAPASQLKNALEALPTISMVTDLPNLFSPTIGNYVNAYEREEGFERPVSMELIKPGGAHGTSAFQINCGYRMRGGVSRADGNPKHSFHFYFRGEYGAGKLEYPLFDGDGAPEFDRIDLRSAQGGSWHQANDSGATYMDDEWSRATQGAMENAHTRSRFVHLYINGHYWGIYATQERADDAFAASYYGGNKEDYDIIKTYVLPHRVEAADGDALAWNELHAKATAGFTSDEAYFAIQGLGPNGLPSSTIKPLVEIDNLIDYMILNMFASNTDGPVNPSANVPKNFYCFRPRDGSAGFRFVAHDFEDTFGGSDVTGINNTGITLAYFNPRWLHLQLAQNIKYRTRFGDRVQRNLFNAGALAKPNAVARWNAMKGVLAPAIVAEASRWGDFKSHSTPRVDQWTTATNSMASSYLVSRPANFISTLRSTTRGYALFPSIDAPVFSQFGGVVTAGFPLTITSPVSTQIYYTVNGEDPTSLNATLYSGSIPLNNAVTTVKARAKDISTGNWSALTEARFTHTPVAAAVGNLIISEFNYNPPPTDPDDLTEFIELFNPSSSLVDLTGVKLVTAVTFTFPSLLLEPGQRVVVIKDRDAFENVHGKHVFIGGIWTGSLNQSGEAIILQAANGTEIERVFYGVTLPWPTAAANNGRSLVRISPTLPANSAYSWRPSIQDNGNPGTSDSAPLSAWLAANGFTAATDLAPSGLKAMIHFAAGMAAEATTSPPLTITRSATYDTITFRRLVASTDSVRCFVEQSNDLASWPVTTEIDAASSGIISRTANADGTENITLQIPATAAQTFYRLRYTTR